MADASENVAKHPHSVSQQLVKQDHMADLEVTSNQAPMTEVSREISAVPRVFDIPELVEGILLQVDSRSFVVARSIA